MPFLTDCKIGTRGHFKKSEIVNKINGYGGRGALLGGSSNNGTNAGFGYLNSNNRSSNTSANYGFRLYRGFNKMIYYFAMTLPHRSCRQCGQLVK